MENLQFTPSGQEALVLAGRLDSSALPLVMAVLAGDLEGARTTGWGWGVWCARRQLNTGLAVPRVSVTAALELASSPSKVAHNALGRITLEGDDLRPTELAGKSIRELEASTQQISFEHRGILLEAVWAIMAGKEAGLKAWRVAK